ncbi:MAG: hypothetical protein IPM24_28540 [Bryobacterales bacterium]|nr:hypothetical protein [Bryobacterales bacterium]
MTSIGFVLTLVKSGADLNSRMTKRVNVGLTSLNTLGATRRSSCTPPGRRTPG